MEPKDGDRIVQLANRIAQQEAVRAKETALKRLRLIIWQYGKAIADLAAQDRNNTEGGK